MPVAPELNVTMRAAMILLGYVAVVLLAISAAWAVSIERLRRGLPLIPARPGGPIPWGGPQVFTCFLIWQFATLVAGAILRARRGPDGAPNLVDAIGAVGLINLALVVALPTLLAAFNGARAIDFGLVRGRIGRDVLLGVVAALVALPIVYAVQFLAIFIWQPTAHPLQEMLLRERAPGVMLMAFVSAVILAPAAEELLFRGILQGWLEKRFGATRAPMFDAGAPPDEAAPPIDTRAGRRIALLFPAVIFSAIHAGQWPAPIPLFVLSIGLGLLYRRTKGIVAPIAMHATFNGMSTVGMIVLVLALPDLKPEMLPGPAEPPAAAPVDGSAAPPRPAGPADSGPRSHPKMESM